MSMTRLHLALLLLPLAGCASPDPRLYTLVATDAPARPAAGQVVELHRVDIPGYLDRPEIVRSAADYRVHLAANDRWSEPFGDLVQRVMADDLTRRLAGAIVYSDSDAISAKPTAMLEVDVRRMDADGAGQAVLDAQFSWRAPDDTRPVMTSSVHFATPIGAGRTADYAAALSLLAGRLADGIAAALPALPEPAQAGL